MSSKMEISFEFFPPKTPEGVVALRKTFKTLMALNPAFFSVTYGAGGSVRDLTLDTITALKDELTQLKGTTRHSQKSLVEFVPHLSCVGSTKEAIEAYLKRALAIPVNQFVALRGDLPSGTIGRRGEFNIATELLAFMRQHVPASTQIYVAGYPERHPDSKTNEAELNYFKAKIDAGANAAITQYFYNIDAFLDWRDRLAKKGVRISLIPGIMPLTQLSGLQRFSNMCGAEIPRWLTNRLETLGEDKEAILAFGIEFMTRFCQRLVQEGVPGLHFYTLNKAEASVGICQGL